ncbi:MAG: YwaF family protein, partial [Bacilli bacterium]|nr:YwaF family protein [Bacilli bacterium]
MAEFFGFGGYSRQPEGYLSPAHLLFVSSLMAMMIFLAVFLGLRYKKRDEKAQSKVLLIAAIAMDSLELFKIVLLCFRNENPLDWLHNLPLFLCSIQLITLPIAALSKGKIKEITLDFLFVFGLLGAVLGTYFAGNNYGAYPVFSFDNVVSGLTHSIAGFGSLYVGITGMAKLKWENFPWCCLTMAVFCLLAYIADVTIPYNYMFLM